jgi:hypothetical protein
MCLKKKILMFHQQIFKRHNLFIFIQFKQFKGRWMCLVFLYILFLDTTNKGGKLKDLELNGTLNV